MAELKNCRSCGRMFSSKEGQEFCSKCRLEVEDHFKIVREFVYDNPGSTVKQVEDGTGVPREEILEYLREEKLELKQESTALHCQRCGKAIKSGRMCTTCAHELKKGFSKAFEADQKDDNKKNGKNKGWHSKH